MNHYHSATRDEARDAKTEIQNLLRDKKGLVGFGTKQALDDTGANTHVVRVYLQDESFKNLVPSEMNGVSVVTEVVGTIRAF